jgi:hypothetical protein
MPPQNLAWASKAATGAAELRRKRMTIHETEMGTVATQRIPRPRSNAWNIAMLLVAGAGVVTVLTLQIGTSGTEPAEKAAATASFSLEAVEQSRVLNESVGSSSIENHSPRASRIEAASMWLQGLADGTILPSDVTSRLRHQQPKVARIVLEAWSASSSAYRGVLDARALNATEAPAGSAGTRVINARLAGIADARALNEYRGATAEASSLQAIADTRALNESSVVATPQKCTLSTIDGC